MSLRESGRLPGKRLSVREAGRLGVHLSAVRERGRSLPRGGNALSLRELGRHISSSPKRRRSERGMPASHSRTSTRPCAKVSLAGSSAKKLCPP
jgi:hypothetical protein